MALFRTKKKIDDKKTKEDTASLPIVHRSAAVADVIRSPRITEKASRVAEKNVYIFNVASTATKKNVSNAVEIRYNVQPKHVRIVPVKEKKVLSRGKQGVRSGGKKAYVYLAAGETIQLT